MIVVTASIGLGSCAAVAESDSGGPQGVRVQHVTDSGRSCLVFTHDTAQGASLAVDCVDAAETRSESHQ
jgi:hypothetical protein